MTADEPPPPTVSESGAGWADQGGIANTGVVHGDVRSEFHVHNDHHHYPRPAWRPWAHRRVSRRLLLRVAAGAGLGVAATAAARRYAFSGPETSGTAELYDSAGRRLRPAGKTVWSVALGMVRGQPLALAGHDDGAVQLWDPLVGKERSDLLPGHDDKVFGLALHGDTAVSSSVDGSVLAWDLTSDPPRNTLLGNRITGGVNGVALGTIAGRTVAVTACGDRTVRVWDPANPALRGRILGSAQAAEVNSVAMGVVDGRTIAVTGSADGAVTLWDVTGERLLRVLGAHTAAVWGLAVGVVNGTPVAVSGGEDGRLRRWDLTAAQPSGEKLLEIPKAVKTVAIGESAGRTIAVAGCDDSSVRVWDLGTGEPFGRGLTGPGEAPQSIAISTLAGRPTVVSGHWGGSVWAWIL